MDNLELLTNAFDRKARKKLWIPQHILENPELEILPVITWMHNKLPLGYIMYNTGDKMIGIVMSATKMSKTIGTSRACMCDLCFQVYSATQIQMFSYQKAENKTVSLYLCSNLDCEKRILDPNTSKLYSTRETLTKEEKIFRYRENVERFFLTHVQSENH